MAALNMPMAALKRSATVTSFDPLTLLPALAMVTEHLGLIAIGRKDALVGAGRSDVADRIPEYGQVVAGR